MPLSGTPREKKHYKKIRKEYPEKGKEYAARVARNIVRANTPGGRKLEGTTEYGRSWGPPYSKPLTKQSMFYNEGIKFACTQLNLLKEGQWGNIAARTLAGAGVGAGLGALTAGEGRRGKGALIGGALGGLSANLNPYLLKRLNPELMAQMPQMGLGAAGIAGGGMGLVPGAVGGLGARLFTDKQPNQ